MYLGVLAEPCVNIITMKHILERLHKTFKIGYKLKHLIVVGDGKTYEMLCKLQTEYLCELSRMIPFPGDCHLLKNMQLVLFKPYFDAGLCPVAEITFKADGLLQCLIKYSSFKQCHRFLLLGVGSSV